jgi:hypothetical protein
MGVRPAAFIALLGSRLLAARANIQKRAAG